MRFNIAVLSLLFSGVLTAPLVDDAIVGEPDFIVDPVEKRATFPFSRIVAFGDDHSDNGNGSYAHGYASPKNPTNRIYGHKTWTNGPIAVTYLSRMIGVPLTLDYAFGGRDGGSKVGATIDRHYTYTTVPDGFQQVANYTSDANATADIANTLHFLWIGNNDINIAHIWLGALAHNRDFSQTMANKTAELVQELIDAGAKYVFVPSLYPKQFAPIAPVYFGITNPANVLLFGLAIQDANLEIARKLKRDFGPNVVTYDLFGFVSNLWNNRLNWGFTAGQTMCDGSGNKAWRQCVIQESPAYFWMQYLMMTTRVYRLIAQDMARAVTAAFAV